MLDALRQLHLVRALPRIEGRQVRVQQLRERQRGLHGGRGVRAGGKRAERAAQLVKDLEHGERGFYEVSLESVHRLKDPCLVERDHERRKEDADVDFLDVLCGGRGLSVGGEATNETGSKRAVRGAATLGQGTP